MVVIANRNLDWIRRLAWAGLGTMALLGTQLMAAERHALLIGVGDYDGYVRRLVGPPHDVQALYTTLVKRWGFEPRNITVLLDQGREVDARTTPDGRNQLGFDSGAATKKGILDALANLQKTTAAGDHIFIYFSGHGTSAKDRNARWPLPYDTAALVPYGFKAEGESLEQLVERLVVGRTEDPLDRDVRSLLLALDDDDPARSRHILVAIDACYSAHAMRSLGFGKTRGTTLPFSFDEDLEGLDVLIDGLDEPYPYDNVFIITAAAEHQEAIDLSGDNLRRYNSIDGDEHGAFTDTLLRILEGELPIRETVVDGVVTNGELFETLRSHMATKDFGHDPGSFPVLEQGALKLRSRPLFSGAGDKAAPSTAPVPPAAALTSSGRLRVAVRPGDKTIEDLLAKAPDLVLDAGDPDVVVRHRAESISLCTAAGEQIAAINGQDRHRLVDFVRHQARARALRAHDNPRQTFAVSLDLAGSRQAGFAMRGEQVAFVVGTERPIYPVLVDVNPGGAIEVLYPVRESELAVLGAGQTRRLPPDTSFTIVVDPPYGRDDVVLLGFSGEPPPPWTVGAVARPGETDYKRLLRALMPDDQRVSRAAIRLKTQDRKAGDTGCR